MKVIDETLVQRVLAYPLLIDKLRERFMNNSSLTPERIHINFEGRADEVKSTLLLMPSWVPYQHMGLKVVTVSPGNPKEGLPSVNGVYLFLDALTGACKYIFGARTITLRRTAAMSALASVYLSRLESKSLLMVGTGGLAPELIKAHAVVRPIERVMVWGRHVNHARAVCELLKTEKFSVEPVDDLELACTQADIISCATLSTRPLLSGNMIHEGQHIDLVGSYRPDMREVNDDVIRSAEIFIDHEGALHESGDLHIPIQNKLITKSDICADMFQLAAGVSKGRKSLDEVTLFKSVGHALEDLVAAEIVVEAYQHTEESKVVVEK